VPAWADITASAPEAPAVALQLARPVRPILAPPYHIVLQEFPAFLHGLCSYLKVMSVFLPRGRGDIVLTFSHRSGGNV
jgi:hypothetical protein